MSAKDYHLIKGWEAAAKDAQPLVTDADCAQAAALIDRFAPSVQLNTKITTGHTNLDQQLECYAVAERHTMLTRLAIEAAIFFATGRNN